MSGAHEGRLEGGLAVEPEAAPGFARAQQVSMRWDGGEVVECRAFEGVSAGAIDARGRLVLPGLVCGHVEAGLALLPGMPPRGKETDAARARRLLDAHDDESLRASARLAALEAAKAGVTVLFDLWRGARIDGALDVIAAAFAEVGIRGALAADVDGTRGESLARAAIAENVRFADAAGDRHRAMMGISEPGTPGPILQEAIGAARRREMAMHLVLAGEPGTRRALAERGGFRAGSVAAIAAPLDDEERALLRDLHVWPVTTPRADAARGSLTPTPLAYMASRVALGGWDAVADVLAEKSAAFLMRRAQTGAESFSEANAFSLLARGYDLAAEIFDVPFGRFSAGAPADFAVFDPPLAAPLLQQTIAAHLSRLSARDLRTVVCAGEVIVRDGVATRVDEAEIRALAREQAKKLWARASV